MRVQPNPLKAFFSSACLCVLLLMACKKEDAQLAADQLPVILSASDSLLPPKGALTLTGKNFSPLALENQVKLNGVLLSSTSLGTNTLYVTMPAYVTSGLLLLTVRGVPAGGIQPFVSVGINKAIYRPTITGASKSTAKVGDTLTVYGSNFDTLPTPSAPQHITLRIGAQVAKILYATPSKIKIQVPGGATTGGISLITAGITINGPSVTIMAAAANQRLAWLVNTRLYSSQVFTGKLDGTSPVAEREIVNIPFTKTKHGENFSTLLGGGIYGAKSQNRIYYSQADSGRVGAVHLDNPALRDTLYLVGSQKDSLTSFGSSIYDNTPFFKPFQVAVDAADAQHQDSLYILAAGYTVTNMYNYRNQANLLFLGSRDGSKQLRRVTGAQFPGNGTTNNAAGLEVVNGTYYVGIQNNGIYAGPVDGSTPPILILSDANFSGFTLSRLTNSIYWTSSTKITLPPPQVGSFTVPTLSMSIYNATNIISPPASPLVVDSSLQYNFQSLSIIPGGSTSMPADQLFWITPNNVGSQAAIWEYDIARATTAPPGIVYQDPEYSSPLNALNMWFGSVNNPPYQGPTLAALTTLY